MNGLPGYPVASVTSPGPILQLAITIRKAAESWPFASNQQKCTDYYDFGVWLYYDLGVCYKYGRGVQMDQAQAVKWFHKAAQWGCRGDADAQYELGCRYYDGVFGLPTNQAEAVKWFRKAAEQDVIYTSVKFAKFHLGYCCLHGIGIEKSDSLAIKYIQSSGLPMTGPHKERLGVPNKFKYEL